MSKLKEQMKADLQLKGFKPSTQQNYLREASNFEEYFEQVTGGAGQRESEEVLTPSVEDKKLSQGTFKFYVSGIKFLCNTTLNRHEWSKTSVPQGQDQTPCCSGPLGG